MTTDIYTVQDLIAALSALSPDAEIRTADGGYVSLRMADASAVTLGATGDIRLVPLYR